MKEFSKLSSRAIAKLCGVSHPFVLPFVKVVTVTTSTVTGTDGKQYPATRTTRTPTSATGTGLDIRRRGDRGRCTCNTPACSEPGEVRDVPEVRRA